MLIICQNIEMQTIPSQLIVHYFKGVYDGLILTARRRETKEQSCAILRTDYLSFSFFSYSILMQQCLNEFYVFNVIHETLYLCGQKYDTIASANWVLICPEFSRQSSILLQNNSILDNTFKQCYHSLNGKIHIIWKLNSEYS